MSRVESQKRVIDATNHDYESAQSAMSKLALRDVDRETFENGIVIEVINDPKWFQENVLESYIENGVIDKQAEFLQLPKNSILYRAISEKSNSKLSMALPFMGSHVLSPIKPGETVWIVDGGPIHYWVSRVGTTFVAEDVNFSDNNRRFDHPFEAPETAKDKQDSSSNSKLLNIPFPSIINQKIGDPSKEKANALQKKEQAEGAQPLLIRPLEDRMKFVLEPVPRFKPRLGDYVIQGSNNTLISLGTDRGFPIDSTLPEQSSVHDMPREKSGTIDIVAGRGMGEVTPTNSNTKGTASDTAPFVIEHVNGTIETDKMTLTNDMRDNPVEGDPHFALDAARVYVSMDTPVDLNFWPSTKYPDMYIGTPEDKQAASIALQANQIRIYAKEDGEVRIVKQGDTSTQACIILGTDGTITVSGEKIFLGRKNGTGEGPESSEPYVKYSELKAYMEEFHSIIDGFCENIEKNKSPGYFQTDIIIKAAGIKLRADQSVLKAKLGNLKSDRIFGE